MSTITDVRAATLTTLGGRRRGRMAAVGGAIVAALIVWFGAEVVFGLDLRSPATGDAEQAKDVTETHVIFAAAVGSLAGWGLLTPEPAERNSPCCGTARTQGSASGAGV